MDYTNMAFCYLEYYLPRTQELRGNIRVHCRVRPVLHFDRGATECVQYIDDVRSDSKGVFAHQHHTILLSSQETVQVSRTHSATSGVVVENKAFEFER